MKKIQIAVVGFGHVGCGVVDAVQEAPDMELVGVILKDDDEIARACRALGRTPVAKDVRELPPVDVAILAVPSRSVPEIAPEYLSLGIHTVDCYDIHGDPVLELRRTLDDIARTKGVVSVISAGWDPGTDSMIRAILEVITPKGITSTNFGPGMSMGHTVAIKSFEGVEDALSLTIPKGCGQHRRQVYIKVQDGYDFDEITDRILRDPYFSHDETHFFPHDDIRELIDVGHGVHMERKGVAGRTHNQRMEFTMSVTNPAATAQVLVSTARAATRQAPGAYSLLEIPVLDFLPGERESLIKRLV